jgi:enoyl-CoA hydratase
VSTRRIRLQQRDGIATLYLDRPPVNAIDLDLVRSIGEHLAQLADDPKDVRAVVITGAGACFSAGLDLKLVPHYTAAEQREMLQTLNHAIGHLYSLPIPTVAAVNGHAIAGGLVLVLACDYRVGTSARCELGLTEARAGIPFPAAPMVVVQAELAPAVARQLTLVARNITPDAALACGILDELQPPQQLQMRAHAVAKDLGSIPHTAYARIKHQLRASAIAQIERILATGDDPMLKSWLSSETGAAASALLARDHDS